MRAAWAMLLLPVWLEAATYYVTVAGLGGEPDYDQRFTSWANEWDKLVKATPDSKSWVLTGAASTRERLRQALAEAASLARADDNLVMLILGHGAFDGAEYKANLVGPDISASELAGLLDRIPAGRQLVVLATSCSGGAIADLRKSSRVVITATRSGTQRNATIFARYWVEALRDPAADADKNEIVTALEAFRFADQKTARFYETQKRIATEHAMLEDTGAGEGVRAPSPENGQGLVASRFPLLRIGAAQQAARDPSRQKLLARKEELEDQVERLKYQKAALPMEEYKRKLQGLLIELARTQAELDKP